MLNRDNRINWSHKLNHQNNTALKHTQKSLNALDAQLADLQSVLDVFGHGGQEHIDADKRQLRRSRILLQLDRFLIPPESHVEQVRAVGKVNESLDSEHKQKQQNTQCFKFTPSKMKDRLKSCNAVLMCRTDSSSLCSAFLRTRETRPVRTFVPLRRPSVSNTALRVDDAAARTNHARSQSTLPRPCETEPCANPA